MKRIKFSYLFSLCIFSCVFGEQAANEETDFTVTTVEDSNSIQPVEEAGTFDETAVAVEEEANFIQESDIVPLSDEEPIVVVVNEDETHFEVTPEEDTNFVAIEEDTTEEAPIVNLDKGESFDRTIANALLQSTDDHKYIDCTFTTIASTYKSDKKRNQIPYHTTNLPTTKPLHSKNWCGYVACSDFASPQVGSVSSVGQVWTVPELSPSVEDSYASVWVGIDGYLNKTIQRIGTEHDWNGDSQKDYAWFQMHPYPAYKINDFPVNPGDIIGAVVDDKGNGEYQLSIFNYTLEVYTYIPLELTTNPKAKSATAAWIVEAPSSGRVLPLANFNTITSIFCRAIINGVVGPVNSPLWQHRQIKMYQGVPKATPSPVSPESDAFIHTWHHS